MSNKQQTIQDKNSAKRVWDIRENMNILQRKTYDIFIDPESHKLD